MLTEPLPPSTFMGSIPTEPSSKNVLPHTPSSIRKSLIQRASSTAQTTSSSSSSSSSSPAKAIDLTSSYFGSFGGQFAPELQIEPLHDLAASFQSLISSDSFWTDYLALTSPFCPTPLHLAKNLTRRAQGATIWLKREDRNNPSSSSSRGSACARSIAGQVLVAKRLGMREVVTVCGSTYHGIACARVCGSLGLKCTVFMGVDDAARQCPGVHEIQRLGATVVPAESGAGGCRSLKAAVNEAFAYALSDQKGIYYAMGGPIGPHPFPVIHRTFQALLGDEVRVQLAGTMGREDAVPDALVCPLGMGGAMATGLFHAFVNDEGVRMVGVQAAKAAPLSDGSEGVLHGCRTLVLQDEDGQIHASEAAAPDMNFPSVGPEVAHWTRMGRLEARTAEDEEAKEGVGILAEEEDVVAGLSTGYAVGETLRLAGELGPGKNVVLLVSGRDDIH